MQTSSPGERAGIEPLVRSGDLAQYREGLARFVSGAWDETRWTSFRLRYGVYAQRRRGQMVRIRIPGGVLPVGWLKPLARVGRDFAQGALHLTTRQDVQVYDVPLDRTPDLIERLAAAGVTTRESGGNTVRNVTACPLAGLCAAERVDAGAVAERLSRAWLRQPLVQNMPRKIKASVSGCGADCAATRFHDLGLIAVRHDGRDGFRVLAGGGTGAQPIAAVEIAPFVTEEELPTVLEALLRVHIAHSTREDRGQARLKFTVRRLGADRFVQLFTAEFSRLRGLPQRPWEPLVWRRPAVPDQKPVGPLVDHSGASAVVVRVPLGLLQPDQLESLAEIAVAFGVSGLRVTREQSILIPGLAASAVQPLIGALKTIGLDAADRPGALGALVSCPGAATCRIGITTSRALGETLAKAGAGTDGLSVHLSGCHNACGLHPLAPIGLRGLARTIEGRVAPHYRLSLGGDPATGTVGFDGPIVPARLADRAVERIRAAIATERAEGESVRAWAERLGAEGLAALLAGLEPETPDSLYFDWGETAPFEGPSKAKGECAAPQVGSEYLGDLATDAVSNVDRFLVAGRWPDALRAAEEATIFALRRVLALQGILTADDEASESVHALFRQSPAATGRLLDAFDSVLAERTAALVTGTAQSYRVAVAGLVDTVLGLVDTPLPRAVASEGAVGDLGQILAGGVA